MNPVDFLSGLSVGVGLAAAVYLLLWWISRRRTSGSVPPPAPPPHHRVDSPTIEPSTPTSAPPSEPAAAPALRRASESSGTTLPAIAVESPSQDQPRRTPPGETLRLSQRVILHVYAQGVRPPGEIAPFALCQAGIVEALGIPQAGLAAVLRRLEAAGILLAERDHVQGRDRRLKVYRLSTRGLDLARELRSRSARRRGAR